MNKILTSFLVIFAIVVIIHYFIKKNPAKVAAIKNAWKNGGATSLLQSLPGGGVVSAVANVVTDNSNSSVVTFPIQLGSSGKAVKMIQAALKVPITGNFDAATQAALQSQSGMMAVDKNTFVSLFEYQANGGAFPLVLGTQSLYVQDVQIMLNLPPNGVLGSDTVAALAGSGYGLPFSQDDYTRLVNGVLQIDQAQTVILSNPTASPVDDGTKSIAELAGYTPSDTIVNTTPANLVKPNITIDYPAPIDDSDSFLFAPITKDFANPPIFNPVMRQPGYVYDAGGNPVGITGTMYPSPLQY